MGFRRSTMLLCAAVLAVGVATPAMAATPTITVLPTPPDSAPVQVNDINDAGVSVGEAWHTRGVHALRWSADGTMTILQPPRMESNNFARGINRSGTIAGISGSSAVQWNTDGTVTELTRPNGMFRTDVWDINDSGEIVGTASDHDVIRPVRWYSPQKPVELEMLPGTTMNRPLAINNGGMVVGEADGQAVRWDRDGRIAALPLPEDTRHSSASGINDRGEIVGNVVIGENPIRGIRWGVDGTITILPLPVGGTGSTVNNINDDGVAVGVTTFHGNPFDHHAVQWNTDGSITGLGAVKGHSQSSAISINNAGGIGGYSQGDGEFRAVRWTP